MSGVGVSPDNWWATWLLLSVLAKDTARTIGIIATFGAYHVAFRHDTPTLELDVYSH